MRKEINWKKYFFEFLSVFIGVTLAFALTTWNERKNRFVSADKTILEIRNGLEFDLEDFTHNMNGHKNGIYACQYFRNYLNDNHINRDSIGILYQGLLRDFISIQNKSGYESLKAKGLELLKDDSLRLETIALYDFYYEIIEKLEETYAENQYHESYFNRINDLLAEYMIFDERGRLINISPPNKLTEEERKLLLSYLWKIEGNRTFTINNYKLVEERIIHLMNHIDSLYLDH